MKIYIKLPGDGEITIEKEPGNGEFTENFFWTLGLIAPLVFLGFLFSQI